MLFEKSKKGGIQMFVPDYSMQAVGIVMILFSLLFSYCVVLYRKERGCSLGGFFCLWLASYALGMVGLIMYVLADVRLYAVEEVAFYALCLAATSVVFYNKSERN